MLSQKILNIIKLSRNKITPSSNIFPLSTSSLHLNNEKKMNETNVDKVESVEDLEKPVLPRNIKVKRPRRYELDFQKLDVEYTPWAFYKYVDTKLNNLRRNIEKFDSDRHRILGPDLAAAHYIVYQGGKALFLNNDEWITLKKDDTVDLPKSYEPGYFLTQLDATGLELIYESFENLKDLKYLEKAIFKNCYMLDDWCLDQMSANLTTLRYLDLSGCPKVTERGLVALYKMTDLKTLIVTNYDKTAAFELTCMMLEDCIPGLQVEILETNEKRVVEINED